MDKAKVALGIAPTITIGRQKNAAAFDFVNYTRLDNGVIVSVTDSGIVHAFRIEDGKWYFDKAHRGEAALRHPQRAMTQEVLEYDHAWFRNNDYVVRHIGPRHMMKEIYRYGEESGYAKIEDVHTMDVHALSPAHAIVEFEFEGTTCYGLETAWWRPLIVLRKDEIEKLTEKTIYGKRLSDAILTRLYGKTYSELRYSMIKATVDFERRDQILCIDNSSDGNYGFAYDGFAVYALSDTDNAIMASDLIDQRFPTKSTFVDIWFDVYGTVYRVLAPAYGAVNAIPNIVKRLPKMPFGKAVRNGRYRGDGFHVSNSGRALRMTNKGLEVIFKHA